jgi:hypothetical protein
MIQRGFIFALIYIKLRVFKFGFDLSFIKSNPDSFVVMFESRRSVGTIKIVVGRDFFIVPPVRTLRNCYSLKRDGAGCKPAPAKEGWYAAQN